MSPKQKRPAADGTADRGAGSADRREHRNSISSSSGDQEPPAAHAIADLIASGLVGSRLHSELWRHHVDARRSEVYLGVALGVTQLVADLTIAETELAVERSGRLDR